MSDEELIKETMMLDYSQLVIHNVYMIKENKRLHSIIKEVREYVSDKERELSVDCYYKFKDLIEFDEISEILDKVGDKE